MRHRWLLAWAIGSVALGSASLLVPLYLVALGAGPFVLGILAATAAAAGAPGAIVVGRMADRTGRRRPFVVGGLLAVAGSLAAMPFTASTAALIALNAVVWFAVAAIGPVVTLLATAGVPEHAWASAIARLNRAQGWGWAGGLVLGAGWAAVLGRLAGTLAAQRSLLVVCAALAAVGALAAARWLPAESAASLADLAGPPATGRTGSVLARTRWMSVRVATAPTIPGRWLWLLQFWRHRDRLDRFPRALRVYYLAVGLFFAGFGAFFAPLPLFLSDVGFGAGAVFGLYVVSSVGSAACYRGAGRLAERFDVARLQVASLLGRGLALPAVAAVGGLWAATALGTGAATLAFAVIGVTWAVIAVTAATSVSRLAPAGTRGVALGLYVALSSLAAGIGSVLGGVLAEVGFATVAATAGGLVVLGALVVVIGTVGPALASVSAGSHP